MLKYFNFLFIMLCYNSVTFSQSQSQDNNLQKFFFEKKGWEISVLTGLTYFHAKKDESFQSTSRSFSIQKKINENYIFSSNVIFGKLKGIRYSGNRHDPYELYEGAGEFFNTNFEQIDFMISRNILNLVKSQDQILISKFDLEFYYSIGIGIAKFYSMRYNLQSKTPIYGYGYVYSEGYSSMPGLNTSLPVTGAIVYGPSINLKLNNNIKIVFSSIIRYMDTKYLDAYASSSDKDNFRTISTGFLFSF